MASAMAFMDESGDLGWHLDLPFGNGGSSRYFVIACVIGFDGSSRHAGAIVKKLHKNQGWTSVREKKWGTITEKARLDFAELAAGKLATSPDLHAVAFVCDKHKCPEYMRTVNVYKTHPHLAPAELQRLDARYRGRQHLVYSMMVAEALGQYLPACDVLAYCPDALNEGYRTLDHLLAYKLCYLSKMPTQLRYKPMSETLQSSLDCADLVAGTVWSHFEQGETTCYDVLSPYLKVHQFP